jgi:SAM-dependent methyltransferase
MVSHLDSRCSSLIAALYADRLPRHAKVLDLMSSCETHLPRERSDLDVSGLGLNADEMAANKALDAFVVHDLNSDPALPFDDAVFDAVICTASVEYLVRPFEVFREIARVSKPGAAVMISFSDRWFPPKAISLWSEIHPFERMAVVLDYFRESGLYNKLYTETVRGYPRPGGDRYAGQMLHSDPVFFVAAVRV